jgi:hypothetical protein
MLAFKDDTGLAKAVDEVGPRSIRELVAQALVPIMSESFRKRRRPTGRTLVALYRLICSSLTKVSVGPRSWLLKICLVKFT